MICKQCGNQIVPNATFCAKCGATIEIPPSEAQPTPESQLKWILPVGRSGLAIAAGYLAFFSVLFFPAPIALIVGLFALADIKKHPEKSGKGRAWFGVVMGGIFTIFLAILVFLNAVHA